MKKYDHCYIFHEVNQLKKKAVFNDNGSLPDPVLMKQNCVSQN